MCDNIERDLSTEHACAKYDRLSRLRDIKNRELNAVIGTDVDAEIRRSEIVQELDVLESACYEAAMRL